MRLQDNDVCKTSKIVWKEAHQAGTSFRSPAGRMGALHTRFSGCDGGGFRGGGTWRNPASTLA